MKHVIEKLYTVVNVCLLVLVIALSNLNAIRYTVSTPTTPQPTAPVKTIPAQPVEQEVILAPEIIEEIPGEHDALIQAFLEKKRELSNSRGLIVQWDYQKFINKLYDTYTTSLPWGIGSREYSQAEKETAWLRALHSKNFAIEPEEIEAAGFTLDELIRYVTDHYQKD